MLRPVLPVLLIAASLLPGQDPTYAGLNSVLWMQTSEEYRGVSLQTFRAARTALDMALKKRDATAVLEQTGRFSKLPPAIILDIDETVFDNSASQARFILQNGGRFDPKMWRAWCEEKKARALPGASDFLNYAKVRGVTVFYVTNRDAVVKPATLENLKAVGLPWDDASTNKQLAAAGFKDTVLLRGERLDWGSDKTTRRGAVAQYYRVVLLFGDDLNDFVTGARTTIEERHRLVAEHGDRWGTTWFMLPNPSYGSWEDSLTGFRTSMKPEEILEIKRKALRLE